MKIKTINGTVVDTNAMTDKKAEIYEAINQLYKVCERYNVTMISQVIISKDNFLCSNYIKKAKENEVTQDGLFLFSLLNNFIQEASGGNFQIAPSRIGGNENLENLPES